MKAVAMFFDHAFFERWKPRVLALLRIVSAYLFILHGTSRLMGVPHVEIFHGLQAVTLVGVIGTLELVAGALLLFGLFTRPIAIILSGHMAFAYLAGHKYEGNVLVPMLDQGELAVLYCYVFLYLGVAGAGSWSLDSMLRSRKSNARRTAVADAMSK